MRLAETGIRPLSAQNRGAKSDGLTQQLDGSCALPHKRRDPPE